jgi:hypothetical protein
MPGGQKTSESLTSKRRWQLRKLFLMPAHSYSVKEASTLAGVKPAELQRLAELHEIDAYHSNEKGGAREWRFRWPAVADIVLRKCGLVGVAAELGADIIKVFPAMALPRMMTFVLPEYQLRMLCYLAAKEGTDAEGFLQNHLLDLASAHLEELEAAYPGFTKALHFPEKFSGDDFDVSANARPDHADD